MYDTRYQPASLKSTNFFKPLKLSSNVTLQHRGALAPLTRLRADQNHVLKQSTDYTDTEEWKNFIAEPANKTGEKKRGLVEEYYHQRSQKPGTLIISEATFISPKAGGYDFAPGIYNEDQVNSLSVVANAIHANGSFVFVQLWNLGRAADPTVLLRDGLPYVSSSDKGIINRYYIGLRNSSSEAGNKLRPLTTEEIIEFKKDYVLATKNALAAGVDGIELHSANGYLLNQFLDKNVNQRTDKYGSQSFENRARLLLEVFDELVAEFGSDKIALRLSPFGVDGDMTGQDDVIDTIDFYSYLYNQFEQRRMVSKGPVYISLVEPRGDNITRVTEQKNSNDFIYNNFQGVVVRAGNILLDGEFTKDVVNKNDRTIIAFGRYFISNPDLIERLENDWPINKYERSTFYGRDFKGYTNYPYFKPT